MSAIFDWSRTYVLGVVNVTPDSFSDGGLFFAGEAAVRQGVALALAGADVLDVGGESTRPGAERVPAAQERRRVEGVIAELRGRVARAPIAIDTTKAEVAEAALAAGAEIVNDVSGGRMEPEILRVAADRGAAVILGHMRGEPRTMQEGIRFDDVVAEVGEELAERVACAALAGVSRERIVVAPGIGFGKTPAQSYQLLRRLGELRARVLRPVCVGPSRKSFLGAVTGAPPGDRLLETAAATAASIALGADIVRLHDAEVIRRVVRVADALRRGLP
ncbi:MAG: dihydropteroate synthase [Myxococcota bacterium]